MWLSILISRLCCQWADVAFDMMLHEEYDCSGMRTEYDIESVSLPTRILCPVLSTMKPVSAENRALFSPAGSMKVQT